MIRWSKIRTIPTEATRDRRVYVCSYRRTTETYSGKLPNSKRLINRDRLCQRDPRLGRCDNTTESRRFWTTRMREEPALGKGAEGVGSKYSRDLYQLRRLQAPFLPERVGRNSGCYLHGDRGTFRRMVRQEEASEIFSCRA